MAIHGTKPSEKFMLWVDSVGGYWVCMAPEVLIGQPGESGEADVPILADISSRHARIVREEENYLIEAIRSVRVDGRPVQEAQWLSNGSRIELGESVKLAIRRPHPLSATARLDFLSRHRTQPQADAVLLMADACVLGPRPHSHVVCRDWTREVVLFRREEKLFCRVAGRFEIDGVPCRDQGLVLRNSRVSGDGFSFTLEPIERNPVP